VVVISITGSLVFMLAAGLISGRLGVVAAVVLDHFGLLHLPQHAASPGRVLGVVLIVAGVSLVAWF